MKIAHIADTHIRNLRDHEHYRRVFDALYQDILKRDVDVVVHAGDVAHSGTDLSPEYFIMARAFFEMLNKVGKYLIVIPGNHDGSVKNKKRINAIDPILSEEQFRGAVTGAACWQHDVDNFTFTHFSIFDKDGWAGLQPKANRINVALYHGLISGVQNDQGYTLHGSEAGSFLIPYDYALLGDIHKSNQTVLNDGRKRYAGSTIQQNFGETNDKGYLLWDIETAHEYSVEHVVIPHPSPFVTCEISRDEWEAGRRVSAPPGARLRVFASGFSPNDLRDLGDEIEGMESVTFIGGDDHAGTIETIETGGSAEDALVTWLSEKEERETRREAALEIWREVRDLDDVADRCYRWEPLRLEWDNLFRYGEGNSLNFRSLSPGIIGILGPNKAGKSSIVDAIFFALYGTASRNNRKTVYLLNKHQDKASVRFEFDVRGQTYAVERELTRKGPDSAAMVTSLYRGDEEITGKTRSDTDEAIRRLVGTADDFLSASFSSQFDALAYINEGSTKRKEVLARFLNLDGFARQFKVVNEMKKAAKSEIKFLDADEKGKKIKLLEEKRLSLRGDLAEFDKQHAELEVRIENESAKVPSVGDIPSPKTISATRQELVRVSDLVESIEAYCKTKEQDKRLLKEKIKEKKAFAKEMKEFIDGLDPEGWDREIAGRNKIRDDLRAAKQRVEYLQGERERINRALSNLDTRPCGDTFLSSCSFLNDVGPMRKRLEGLEEESAEVKNIISSLVVPDISDIEEMRKNFHVLQGKYSNHISDISSWQSELSGIESAISDLEDQHEDGLKRRADLEARIEDLSKVEDLATEHEERTREVERLKSKKKEVSRARDQVKYEIGATEASLKENRNQLDRARIALEKLSILDLLAKALHANGVPFAIVQANLDRINTILSELLASVPGYDIEFRAEGKKLEIYLDNGEAEALPLDAIGSGAEKTLASTAIRLAMASISQIPSGEIFVLDEPATALDVKNMEVFVNMLRRISTSFKYVFVISHIDNLKDAVDQVISIDMGEKFSSVEV